MKHPSYKAAIAFIAHNDAPGDEDPLEILLGYATVVMVSELFDVDQNKVARDVLEYRLKQGIQKAKLCIRIGDQGDYQGFDDLDSAIESMKESHVGHFVRHVPRGIETFAYSGQNYISIFWGDKDSEFICDLNADERTAVKRGLRPKGDGVARLINSLPPNAKLEFGPGK